VLLIRKVELRATPTEAEEEAIVGERLLFLGFETSHTLDHSVDADRRAPRLFAFYPADAAKLA
jgi:hypothetical protein